MITRIVKLNIESSAVDEFMSVLGQVRHRIEQFEGCRSLELLSDKKDRTVFFSYSIWESEDHLDKYRNSEVFREIWNAIKKYVTSKPNAWTVENTL